MPPANIGYCRRNRSRSRGKRVRVHGTGGSEPRPLSGRLVSSAIIFIAIDKANIVNLLTTGRSYVKTPKGRRETSAPRPPRVSASTEARVGETAEERERKKEREKENARKGEAKRGREMERKGARARAREGEREREYSPRATGARVYTPGTLLSPVKVPRRKLRADLWTRRYTRTRSRFRRKMLGRRHLAASRLTCARCTAAASARYDYLRAYVDGRHVCQNKKYIYGTGGTTRRAAQPKVCARDDD